MTPLLNTGGVWRRRIETVGKGQGLTADSQRKEASRKTTQINAIVVDAKVTAEGP